MIFRPFTILAFVVMTAPVLHAQNNSEVMLMTPAEQKKVDAQAKQFKGLLGPVLKEAASSMLRIWGTDPRFGAEKLLAYGTVVGDGSQLLTKWSEIEKYTQSLVAQDGKKNAYNVEIKGVYTEEDLALLQLSAFEGEDPVSLTSAKFSEATLKHGQFLFAPRPEGSLAAFGVVGVLERNLRETDRAHLGIMADTKYQGDGVKIKSVQPEYGAAEAGLKPGDIILAIGDRSISGFQELRNALAGKKPGDELKMKIATSGKTREVDVMLSNRPLMGQFRGGRLRQMEKMGGKLNRVRDGFGEVVQTDMRLRYNEVGGPVVNLNGEVVGVSIARGDRTKSYFFSSQAIQKLMQGKLDTIEEARTKRDVMQRELKRQRQAMLPRMRPQGKIRSLGQLQRNSADLGRLLRLLRSEMEALEESDR